MRMKHITPSVTLWPQNPCLPRELWWLNSYWVVWCDLPCTVLVPESRYITPRMHLVKVLTFSCSPLPALLREWREKGTWILLRCLVHGVRSVEQERGCGQMAGWTGPTGHEKTTSKIPNWVHRFTGKAWKTLWSIKFYNTRKHFSILMLPQSYPWLSL